MPVLDEEQTHSRVGISLGWLPPKQAWERLMSYPFGVKTLFIGYVGGFLLSLFWDTLTWASSGVPVHTGPIPIYFELAIGVQLMVVLALWLMPMIGYPAAMVALGLDILYQWLMVGIDPGTMGFMMIIVEGVYLVYFLFTIPLLQYRLVEAHQG